jgi:hypothetical protein
MLSFFRAIQVFNAMWHVLVPLLRPLLAGSEPLPLAARAGLGRDSMQTSKTSLSFGLLKQSGSALTWLFCWFPSAPASPTDSYERTSHPVLSLSFIDSGRSGREAGSTEDSVKLVWRHASRRPWPTSTLITVVVRFSLLALHVSHSSFTLAHREASGEMCDCCRRPRGKAHCHGQMLGGRAAKP